MNRFIWCLGCLFLFTACQDAANQGMSYSKESRDESMAGMVPEYEMDGNGDYNNSQAPSTSANESTSVAPKIIKFAEMRMEVEDVDQSTIQIEQLVTKMGGRVGSMTRSNNDYQEENVLTLRIPSQQFDQLITGLKKEAIYEDFVRITSQDVTEEYLDVEARLATKKAVRDRYVEVLRRQAKTVEDILQAEEAIRVVQEEIESKEGRLRFLKDRIGMSTVNVEIYKQLERPAVRRYTFWNRAVDRLSTGWQMIQDTTLMLITLWPFLIIGVIAWWLWRRRRAG